MSTTSPPRPTGPPRHISRAPVYVVVVGLAVAFTLVFIAAGAATRTTPPPPIARAGTPDAPRDVTVIMREYAFAPSPLALVPGETVRLTILDAGLAPHELVLGDAAVQDAWTAADAAATPGAFATPPLASVPPGTGGLRVLLESGRQTIVTYTVPMDERLTMVCHIADHRERGMVADVLLVQPVAAPDARLDTRQSAKMEDATEALGR